MVEGEAAAFVYLDNGEGGAVDGFFYAEAFGYALGEDGFARCPGRRLGCRFGRGWLFGRWIGPG